MAYYHHSYGNLSDRKKNKFRRKIIIFVIITFLFATLISAFEVYRIFFKTNVWTSNEPSVEVIIPTGCDHLGVKDILYKKGLIIRRNHFEWVSKWLGYNETIKPGRYLIRPKMNNFDLVRQLRSGAQTPVMVTFNNIRDVNQLAGRVASQIEADSTSIADLLSDTSYLSFLGHNRYTISSLFIPDSYEFYWTTSAESFISRMFQENKKFWNPTRKGKADALNMSAVEVSILASIVEKESNKNDEKASIAGVYINRLKSGWLLQADPTLVYAVGDFEIRRVLDVHKLIESPYNTYKYAGLPPGPICIPSVSSIDAVLNYQDHRYYYFCAKDDLSGYHAFAENYAKHQLNAWKYRQALNRMNINK
ncbi:MAG: endolytic transglycosylase MltG [Bacteroidetes bacterium HGW-Bacteroidetes-1]|jgi:UPF0755 protein|nr:MAG: endolytic transglycosylase MltG [Bacteroidetes bacterium HGW-Bacteroidetes-1]